ncbi:HNH endonuclease [Verminephrobacter eiseniae]|nr:HNH endonuclease [Verminephrobacter sp. Larva24]MCW5232455.1 HNH endonuclease [Verminephrobacter eiseniae]MCW5295979.1 HNH endonuclease [Verminephrobacter eiseniae]MCW8183976.1 HNH endonuclease [Verminephrobacter eiseniae]MCW8221630.1 HNH endonuclease [Verminephrobacter eiseniae]
MQDARTSGTASQYFLGSIVLIKNDREPKSSLHVRKNPAASNYDFATKKNVYFKGKGTASPFILTQEVRSEGAWTPVMLNDRQKRLVGVLEKHWELEVPPTESVSKAPDTTTASQGQA